MNSIDDLRRTVAEQADPDLTARPAAVRARVARLRRQRRAAGAVCVAAVVAVVGGIAVAVDSTDTAPEPADRTVVGVDVPETLESLGYTYAVSDTVAGSDGKVRVELPADDEPRLVSWATSGEDDTVRVSGTAVGDPLTTSATDFTDWVLIPAGQELTTAITAERSTPGIAVYQLTDDRPEGTTVAGVTFRDEVAGAELLGAVAGEPGQTSVEVPARTPADSAGLVVHATCLGASTTAELSIGQADRPGASTRFGDGICDPQVPVDGSTEITPTGRAANPNTDVTTTVTLRARGEGELPDDVRLVVGVYATSLAPTNGRRDPDQVEYAGHRWEQVSTATVDGRRSLSATAPGGDRESLVRLSVRTPGGTRNVLHSWFEGRRGSDIQAEGTAGFSSTQRIVSPGAPVRATVSAPADLRMTFYRRAD